MTSENTKNESQSQKTTRYIWYFFVILIVFTYFFGLTVPFVGPDEPRYAQVAREMLERGDWITPTLGGFDWFEKPALFYWLEIVSYRLFGVNEFAARVGSALFGLGTIASLWILGRYLATEGTEAPAIVENSQVSSKNSVRSVANDFANYLAVVAASTIGILVFSRGASFDIIITFPITAALVSFFIWHSKSEAQPNRTASPRPGVSASLLLFYVFIGIALLAKGLIGIIFPYAIVAFYYLLARRVPSKTFLLSLAWGTLIAVAVASTWYVPMYLRHGYGFVDEFFIQHHFQRFTSNKYKHPQPFYFFVWVLPLMTIPWLPFFIASIWRMIKTIFQPKNAETRSVENLQVPPSPDLPFSSSPLLLFSISWLLVPLAFFSFSGSKLPGYILPAVPAAIILATHSIHLFIQKNRTRRIAIQITAVCVFGTAIILLCTVVPRYAESDSVKSLIAAADARGYSNDRVLGLHVTSNNAEFYAAGRLLRAEDGKQKRLYGPAEVTQEMRRIGASTSLVLLPLQYLQQLTASENLHTEWIKDNGKLALVRVTLK